MTRPYRLAALPKWLSRADAGRQRGLLFVGIVLIIFVFGMVTATGMYLTWKAHRLKALEQLQSISRLKTAHLENWLDERKNDARFVSRAYPFNEWLEQWRTGDAGARERILRRIEEFRAIFHYSSLLLSDAQGNILVQTGETDHGIAEEALREALEIAVAKGDIQMTELYLMSHPAPAHAHLDFVAPIKSPRTSATVTTAVVMRTDVGRVFSPYFQVWPVPSASAETLLFRRDGDDVLYLNELRHRKNTALTLRLPLSEPALLAAQALAADHRPGSLLEGADYRGVPAMGVARPVAGTSWWVITKMDRAEVFDAAAKEMLWIVVTGLLGLAVTLSSIVLMAQRRELQLTLQQRQEQSKKLQALGVLSAITESSADAIYAKDRAGCYLLFNHAACQYTGKSEAEVLGRDDSLLFPADQACMLNSNDERVINEKRVLSFEETLETVQGTRTFLAVKGPLYDQSGHVMGLYGIARDISDRAYAEEALRTKNEELQRFNQAMIGREMEMIRLKREINRLCTEQGRPAPYRLETIDEDAPGFPSTAHQ